MEWVPKDIPSFIAQSRESPEIHPIIHNRFSVFPQERYTSAAAALNTLQERMGGLDLEYRGLGDEAEALEEETVRLEDEYLLLKETAGLLLDGDGNVSVPPGSPCLKGSV
jgi:hypothetical protein